MMDVFEYTVYIRNLIVLWLKTLKLHAAEWRDYHKKIKFYMKMRP